MNNIIDDAHIFAKSLKECQEVIELKKARDAILANQPCTQMLEEFRVLQVEAFTERQKTGDISEDTKKKFEKYSQFAIANPDFANYLVAEQKFGVVWEDVMKIFNEVIGENIAGNASK